MIRDTLTELHGATELEIVKKVRHLKAIRRRCVTDCLKLASSLDISSLGDVGRKVNEIVGYPYLSLLCYPFRNLD